MKEKNINNSVNSQRFVSLSQWFMSPLQWFVSPRTTQGNMATLLLAVLFALQGCKKESVPPPSYQDGVFFYVPYSSKNTSPVSGMTDLQYNFSGSYSYYFADAATTVDTFWLPTARILGEAKATDRAINLEVIPDGTTATAGTHYKLLDYKIAGGAFTNSRMGVVIPRSADLDDKSVTLKLQLKPSNDFPATMMTDTLLPGDDGLRFYQGTSFTLTITNQAVRPPYWNTVSLFGTWSKVKYEYIYGILGLKLGLTANNTTEQANQFSYYLQVRTRWLQEHAPPNPDLVDENGETINFW